MAARTREKRQITDEVREEAVARCRALIETGVSRTAASKQVSEDMKKTMGKSAPSSASVYRWTASAITLDSIVARSAGDSANQIERETTDTSDAVDDTEAADDGTTEEAEPEETGEEEAADDTEEEEEVEYEEVDLEEYSKEVRAPLLRELAAKDDEIRELQAKVEALSLAVSHNDPGGAAAAVEEAAALRKAVAALKQLVDIYMPH